jgi:hypothetical protein
VEGEVHAYAVELGLLRAARGDHWFAVEQVREQGQVLEAQEDRWCVWGLGQVHVVRGAQTAFVEQARTPDRRASLVADRKASHRKA